MRCSVCGEAFGGVTAHDLHRVGELPEYAPVGEAAKHRRCLTPSEMRAAGLKRDGRGRWCRTLAAAKDDIAA